MKLTQLMQHKRMVGICSVCGQEVDLSLAPDEANLGTFCHMSVDGSGKACEGGAKPFRGQVLFREKIVTARQQPMGASSWNVTYRVL